MPYGGAGEVGCPVCGLELSAPGLCPNRWCWRADRGFSVVFALGAHQRNLRHAIARYKYRRELWLADVFAGMVARYLDAHVPWFEEFDVIGGVPSYQGPGATRTWDPVGLILDRLAVRVGDLWRVSPDLLIKVGPTPPMQGRTWATRQSIATGPLRRALRANRLELIEGRRILVLDDVLTEGGTLREVARCLLRAGATEVAGLVISRHGWAEVAPPMVWEPVAPYRERVGTRLARRGTYGAISAG